MQNQKMKWLPNKAIQRVSIQESEKGFKLSSEMHAHINVKTESLFFTFFLPTIKM